MKPTFLYILVLTTSIVMAQKPKIIAHRGYWDTDNATENSIASLANAQKIKVYGSEFDIQFTKDEKLIVFHDSKINKKLIEEINYNELIKIISAENKATPPLLEDYLKQGVKDSNCRLIVEIKPLSPEEKETLVVEKVLALIKKYNLLKQCDFISFSLHICKEVKRLSPESHVQYLKGDLNPEEVKKQGLDGIDYDYRKYERNPHWIRQARMLGLSTNAWTVNNEKDFKWLAWLGIDYITTDKPEEFKKLINNSK